MIVAIGMGADPAVVSQGLYGFSPVLTAMAVGVIFLTTSPRVAVYALLATVVTVFVQGRSTSSSRRWGSRPSRLPMS